MRLRLFFSIAGTLLIALSLGLGLRGAALLILILGLTALSGAFLPAIPKKSLAMVFGITAVLLGGYILLLKQDFLGTALSTRQGLLMLALGIYGFFAAFGKRTA